MTAYGAIPYLKALHIATLVVWCACLFGMPFLIAMHRGTTEQRDYSRIRRFAHFSYIGVATPAAVLAVASGTALIFVREVFHPWMFAKLVVVGLLVCLHGYMGHLNVQVGEQPGDYRPPRGTPLSIGVAVLSTVILLLVLAKPDLGALQFPSWLSAPLGKPLPVDEVPI